MRNTVFCIALLCIVFAVVSSEFCNFEIARKGGKGCYIIQSASIIIKNFEMEDKRSEDVEMIDFQGNKNISFLPIKLHRKFPSLRDYVAERCNIGEISQANFENLFHLEELNLYGNRIEIVRRDTFKYLVSVKKIYLSEFLVVKLETKIQFIYYANRRKQNQKS